MPWWQSRAALAACALAAAALVLFAVALGVRPQRERVNGRAVECPSVISGHLRPDESRPPGPGMPEDGCDEETRDDLIVMIDVAAVGLALTVTAVVLHRRRRSPWRSRGKGVRAST